MNFSPTLMVCSHRGNKKALNKAYDNVALAHSSQARLFRCRHRMGRVMRHRYKRRLSASDENKRQHCFNVATKIKGRKGLLIDTGSPGNITGDGWLISQHISAARYGRRTTHVIEPRPLNISGVGNGSQSRLSDHQVPIALKTKEDAD